MDIDAVLNQAREDLVVAEERFLAAQVEVDDLRRMISGLEIAVAKYPQSPAMRREEAPRTATALDPVEMNSWLVLNKENAALRALKEIGGVLVETRFVAEKLRAVGYPTDSRAVKGYMNSLKRKGLVVSVRPGFWSLAENEMAATSSPSNDFGPAILAGPREASTDDVPSQGTVLTGAFGASQPAR